MNKQRQIGIIMALGAVVGGGLGTLKGLGGEAFQASSVAVKEVSRTTELVRVAETKSLTATSTEKSATASAASESAETFACDDTLYLMQVIDEKSELYTVDSAANFTQVGVRSEYKHNSTAFNAQDGYMYGVSGKNLIRIGQTGETVLGQVDVSSPYSGAFMADGTYVVNNSNTIWHIDIATVAVTKSVSVGGTFADIARNPIDGLFYGFDNKTQKLAAVNPHTGALGYVSESLSGTIRQAGAAFFRADGTLFLYGKGVDSAKQDTLFMADVTAGTVKVVKKGAEISGSDGTSCVQGKDANPDDEPGEEPEVEVEICVEEKEIMVLESELADYLKKGATAGECPEIEEPKEEVEEVQYETRTVLSPIAKVLPDRVKEEKKIVQFEQSKSTIQVCQETRSGAGQCVAMYPAEGTAEYAAYMACAETKGHQSCLTDWAIGKGYQTCGQDSHCSGEVKEEIEVEVYEGCLKHEGGIYCPHRAENECVEVKGLRGDTGVYCQGAEQDIILVKRCEEVRASSSDPRAHRAGKVCGMEKYALHVEGAGAPVETFTLERTYEDCSLAVNPTDDAVFVKGNKCRYDIRPLLN